MKECSVCGVAKPVSEFGPGKRWPDGLSRRCLACVKAARRAAEKRWVNANRAKVNAAARIRHSSEEGRAYRREYNKRRPEVNQASARRHKLKTHGLTPEEFALMSERQGHCCAICGTDKAVATNEPGQLYVDHDHMTGAVRALLCRNCNFALGLLADEPSLMRQAATYIESFELGDHNADSTGNLG